jgi:hypothetical protein
VAVLSADEARSFMADNKIYHSIPGPSGCQHSNRVIVSE